MDFIVEMGCACAVIYLYHKLYSYKNIPRMVLIDYLKVQHKFLKVFAIAILWFLFSKQYSDIMPFYVYNSIDIFIVFMVINAFSEQESDKV
ncbi:MAG: hypothetical protein ACRCST_08575 [Turicibacter sp.]